MTCFRTGFCAGVILCTWLVSSAAQAQSIGFSISDNASDPSQLTVTVIDDQTQAPIKDARVSLNDFVGFTSRRKMPNQESQKMRVDANGTAYFFGLSPSPKTVTVSKAGYATLSVVGVQGSAMIASLHPITDQSSSVVASGVVNNWDGASDDSSTAHAALVFRTLSAMDLLDFQLSKFISPLKDSLDLGGIAGKHKIPSNIAIPEQSVSYLFFNVDLNKPTYRLPIPPSVPVGLTALEVQANVSDAVSAATTHPFNYDLFNKITFLRAGMTQNFTASSDTQVNVDATMPLTAQHDVSISQTPPFQADVIAASLTDMTGDKSVLVPTDLKTVLNSQNDDGPQTVTLAAPDASAGISPDKLSVATIAIGAKGTQISGVLVPSAGKSVQAGQFLDSQALPQNQAIPSSVQVAAPAQGVGAAIFATDQPVWYVYTLPVAGSVSVPTAKISAAEKLSSYSVNQIEFSQFNASSLDGSKVMSNLQRFARSSAKLVN